MEPLRETREALAEVHEDGDEARLLESLLEMGERARAIVPECVGLSLCLVRDRLTFTLVASSMDAVRLDGAQYLAGEPCLRDDGQDDVIVARRQDPLDEEQWSLSARTGAAAGVESSLSLPVLRDDVVIGGINLYAASPDAFEGHVEAMAQALGAEASAAVSDADLSFSSRLEAVQAPARIRDRYDVDSALGILASRFAESVDESRERLRQASAQAGVSEVVVARILIDLHTAH